MMITHCLLFIFAAACCEIFHIFKLTVLLQDNVLAYKKILALLKKHGVSDHWKEKALLGYSQLLFFSSIRIMLVVSIIAAVFLACIYVDSAVYTVIASFVGILETTLFVCIYCYLRKYLSASI